MKFISQFQESLFPDLPTAQDQEAFELRILEALEEQKINFTRKKLSEMGPEYEFVASVWVGEMRVLEVCGRLNGLNFRHAESTARRTLELLRDRGIQAALKLNGYSWEELAEQTEWILRKIKTTRPDGYPRAKKKGGRK